MDGLWATKSEGVGLIVRAISFKIYNLRDPDPPTDRQTNFGIMMNVSRVL